MKREKIIIISAAGLVVLLIILAVFGNLITIPQSVSTYLEVYPQKKWVLLHNPQGQLISKLTDNELGRISNYQLIQFDRGEEVNVGFHESVFKKKTINKGDVILSAGSSLIAEGIAKLEGELDINKSELEIASSGEKESLLKEAAARVDFASAKVDEQKILFERSQKLFEKGAISKEEFEFQEWQYKFFEIERKVAQSSLETLATGSKPQQIAFIKSKISSLTNELALLKKRAGNLTISSPISGKINFSHNAIDTLLSVSSINEVILNVPVRLVDYYKFSANKKITIYFPTLGITLQGQLLRLSNEVKILLGRQVVYASILVPNTNNKLMPGMILESSVKIGKITLLDYLKEFFVN